MNVLHGEVVALGACKTTNWTTHLLLNSLKVLLANEEVAQLSTAGSRVQTALFFVMPSCDSLFFIGRLLGSIRLQGMLLEGVSSFELNLIVHTNQSALAAANQTVDIDTTDCDKEATEDRADNDNKDDYGSYLVLIIIFSKNVISID
jgi:hypothetical protein